MEKIRSKNNRTLTITEEEKANEDKSIQGYDGVFWERNSIKK